MNRDAILTALRTAAFGSEELLDAVEAACDAGGELLRLCDELGAKEAAITAEYCRGIPDEKKKKYTVRNQERFQRLALKKWVGARLHGTDLSEEENHG